jgi:monoamine oxidase
MKNLLLHRISTLLHRSNGENPLSRREFIQQSMLALGASRVLSERKLEKPICIIGAGISGLYAAYLLQKAGYEVIIYEAADHTGGRMMTIRNYFGENLHVDIGGEFINADHADILGLCKDFDIELLDTQNSNLNDTAFFFEGKKLENEAILALLAPFSQALLADIAQIPDLPTYKNAKEYAHFDQLSIAEYLQSKKITGTLYRIFESVFVSEYGRDIEKQSAMNLLYALRLPKTKEEVSKNNFFGEGSEIFRVKNGSQTITDKLTEVLGEKIFLNHKLTDIAAKGKQYELSFLKDGKKVTVEAAYILITIPFTRLRRVKFHRIDIPNRKKLSIQKYCLGNNAKAIYGFTKPVWHEKNESGHTYSDEYSYCSWDASYLKSNIDFAYTHFSGGKQVLLWAKNSKTLTEKHITQIEKNFTGAKSAFNNKVFWYFWQENPDIGGSYTAHPKGFWSQTVGVEAEPIGNIYFAGEHCSILYQGFMNGAAETGRQAVEMMIAKIEKDK